MCIAANLIISIVLSIYNLPRPTGQCSGIFVAEPYLSNQFAISSHAFFQCAFPLWLMCRWCLHWPLYSSHVAFCVMRCNWPLNLPDDLQATCAANSSLPYYLHSLHLLKVSPFPSFFNPLFIAHCLSSSGLNLYYHQATTLSYLKSGHWYLFSKPFRRTRIIVDRLFLQKVCKEIRRNGLAPNHHLRRLNSSGI